MFLLLTLAHALPPPADVRSAMQVESNWEEFGTKTTEVGEVKQRHLNLDGVDCLEGTVITQVPLDTLLAITVDVANNPLWTSSDLAFSELLYEGLDGIHYLQLLQNPAPISDRYWYLQGRVTQDGDGKVFSWDHLDGSQHYPPRHAALMTQHGGAVEVAFNLGSWSFYPRPDGRTLARFRSCTNAGGRIPLWIAEAAAKALLPNNLVDLIRYAESR